MQLHQFSDTIQDLCHEGYSLCAVHFGVGDVSYILKAVDVTNGSVTFRLQAEPQQAVHEGFLGVVKSTTLASVTQDVRNLQKVKKKLDLKG